MADTSARLPLVLTAYGLPHVMGFLATKDGAPNPDPLTITGFMDAAVEMGLAGVEIPIHGTGSSVGEGKGAELPSVPELKDALAARGLRVIPDWLVILDRDAPSTIAALRAAKELGSNVMRVTLSRILCGDRRQLAGGWEAYRDAVAARLDEVLPAADDLGVAVALENHQDATSDDLLWLYERTGKRPSFGVCLDTGNPLAVGEGVVEFAERVAPLIRHVHLKDYTLHYAPEGYRLVRCPAGEGVVDFPRLLEIVRENDRDILPGCEIAAQATRTVPLLETSWWDYYPERQGRFLHEALRVLWEEGRPADEPYGSAWERGGDSAAVAAEEWDVARRSVDYFRTILS